jgi:hypothetical protein
MSARMRKAWRMEVRWRDSKLDNGGWLPVKEHMRGRRGVPCYSVGFVLADDKIGVSLASSVHADKAAGVVHIPAGMIVKRRRLR